MELNPIQCCAYTWMARKLNIEMALGNAAGLRASTLGMLALRAARVEDVFRAFDFDRARRGRGRRRRLHPGRRARRRRVRRRPLRGPGAEYSRYYKLGEGLYYLFYRQRHLCHLETTRAIALAALYGRGAAARFAAPHGRLRRRSPSATWPRANSVPHGIGGDQAMASSPTRRRRSAARWLLIVLLDTESEAVAHRAARRVRCAADARRRGGAGLRARTLDGQAALGAGCSRWTSRARTSWCSAAACAACMRRAHAAGRRPARDGPRAPRGARRAGGGARADGNFHDFGVHQLHATDPAIFADIRGPMGERLIPVAKKAPIRYGRGFRYLLEFTDLVTGIPPWTLVRALLGLLAQARNRLRLRRRTPRKRSSPTASRCTAFPRLRTATGHPARAAVRVVRAQDKAAAVRGRRRQEGALQRFSPKDERGAAVESAVKDETSRYSPTGARDAAGSSPTTFAGAAAVSARERRRRARRRTMGGARPPRYRLRDARVGLRRRAVHDPAGRAHRGAGQAAPGNARRHGVAPQARRGTAPAPGASWTRCTSITASASSTAWRNRPTAAWLSGRAGTSSSWPRSATCDVGDDRWIGGR
ncbi:MAG: hypothetical protein U0470_01695 [Anaerolineae bacterium]